MAPISRDILLLAMGGFIAIAIPWGIRLMERRNHKPTNRED